MVVRSMLVMENLKHYTTTSLLLPLNLRTIALRAPLEVRESRNPCFTESDRLEMLGDTVYLSREGKVKIEIESVEPQIFTVGRAFFFVCINQALSQQPDVRRAICKSS